MSRGVYKYKVWCEDDEKYEYLWAESTPNKCPANPAHTITTSATTIVDQIKTNTVRIQENVVATGENYQIDQYEIVAAPNTITSCLYTNPDYGINAFNVVLSTQEENRGDTLDIVISPNTIVGIAMAAILTGDTVFTVSTTVLDYAMVGYRLSIADGTNTDICGVIRSMDRLTSQITVSIAATHNFSPLSPTYIKIGIAYTRFPLKFGPAATMAFGTSKIGGSYIAAGTEIRLNYTNNSSTEKTMLIFAETEY